MIRVERYRPEAAAAWNLFAGAAKNGLFLFDRGYMDYHADRFTDHSLLFWQGEKLVGLMPASVRDDVLTSHGGLTFGGVLCDHRMRTGMMLELFQSLRAHLSAEGLSKLVYKAAPHIYHQIPAEEDLYALVANGARLVRRDVSSTIDLRARPAYAKGRKWSLGRARKNDLKVMESQAFRAFMDLEEAHLAEKFGVKPTHSGEELELLAGRFPANIRLFTVTRDAHLLAGVVIYESAMVAHAQYIASTQNGRDAGALDAIIDHLLTSAYPATHPFFDFGISTERGGTYLNSGLIENKESYGGRATVHDVYELNAG